MVSLSRAVSEVPRSGWGGSLYDRDGMWKAYANLHFCSDKTWSFCILSDLYAKKERNFFLLQVKSRYLGIWAHHGQNLGVGNVNLTSDKSCEMGWKEVFALSIVFQTDRIRRRVDEADLEWDLALALHLNLLTKKASFYFDASRNFRLLTESEATAHFLKRKKERKSTELCFFAGSSGVKKGIG